MVRQPVLCVISVRLVLREFILAIENEKSGRHERRVCVLLVLCWRSRHFATDEILPINNQFQEVDVRRSRNRFRTEMFIAVWN